MLSKQGTLLVHLLIVSGQLYMQYVWCGSNHIEYFYVQLPDLLQYKNVELIWVITLVCVLHFLLYG